MWRRLCTVLLLCVLAACGCGGGGGGGDAKSTAALAWSASADPAVAGYRVYYGTAPRSYLQPRGSGIDVGPVPGHVVTGLTAGTLYYFAVTAFDAEGNESDYSNEASKQMQ